MREPSFAALIDILKASKDSAPKREWGELEDHVRKVYQTLLDLDGEQTMVARDVLLRGRDGSHYQIDVYYEFKLAGISHRVAIECKNTKRPVERNDVLAFKGKLDDCQGLLGVMVSANGYQDGAAKFARDNNIHALTHQELPSIGHLLGLRLENAILPSIETIGQPFWTIFNLDTFEPLGQSQGDDLFGVLFFSRAQAEKFRKEKGLSPKWVVRGMAPRHLGSYIMTVDAMNGCYAIAVPHLSNETVPMPVFVGIDRSKLIGDFYQGADLPTQPMVMPSLRKSR